MTTTSQDIEMTENSLQTQQEQAGDQKPSTDDVAISNDESHSECDQANESRAAHVDLIAEARRYRKRAQAAEKSAEQLTTELAARKSIIAQQNERISALERRQAIDEQLRTANAHDVDAARLLAEEALAEEGSLSIQGAIEQVKAARPWLFQSARLRSPGLAGAMSPSAMDRSSASNGSQRLSDAAEEAHASGNRRDLLRYLRLRRRRTAQ